MGLGVENVPPSLFCLAECFTAVKQGRPEDKPRPRQVHARCEVGGGTSVPLPQITDGEGATGAETAVLVPEGRKSSKTIEQMAASFAAALGPQKKKGTPSRHQLQFAHFAIRANPRG